MSLVIPASENDFESHPKQSELLKTASDQGVYLRIETTCDLDIEFIHYDDSDSEVPLLRDRRTVIDLDFLSPHFTPWDELFDLNDDGSWKLKWEWKICDVDGLMKGWETAVDKK